MKMMLTASVHITTSAASLNFSLPKHVILSLAQIFNRYSLSASSLVQIFFWFSLSVSSLAHLLQIISLIYSFSNLICVTLSSHILIGESVISRLEIACDWMDVAFTGGWFHIYNQHFYNQRNFLRILFFKWNLKTETIIFKLLAFLKYVFL